MQTDAPTQAPAWTYQAPRRPTNSSSQCYYRGVEFHHMGDFDPMDEKPRLSLFRWTGEQTSKLSLELPGVGNLSAKLDFQQLTMLRDACSDALEDIVADQLRAVRQAQLDEISEQMRQDEEAGCPGATLYAHPDVHYVATQEAATAKLASIDIGIVIVRGDDAPAAAETDPPLCVNCRHLCDSMCNHPEATPSLVNGKSTQSAAFMRVAKNSNADGACGRAGRLFEAAPAAQLCES